VVALERVRPDVRLVVPGALAALAQKLTDLGLGGADLGLEPTGVGDQRLPDLGDLCGRPGRLPRALRLAGAVFLAAVAFCAGSVFLAVTDFLAGAVFVAGVVLAAALVATSTVAGFFAAIRYAFLTVCGPRVRCGEDRRICARHQMVPPTARPSPTLTAPHSDDEAITSEPPEERSVPDPLEPAAARHERAATAARRRRPRRVVPRDRRT
jgi:hypothetical protein